MCTNWEDIYFFLISANWIAVCRMLTDIVVRIEALLPACLRKEPASFDAPPITININHIYPERKCFLLQWRSQKFIRNRGICYFFTICVYAYVPVCKCLYIVQQQTQSQEGGLKGISTDGAGSFTPTFSTFDLPRLFFSICPGYEKYKNPQKSQQAGRQICNKFSFKTRTQISPIRWLDKKREKLGKIQRRWRGES